MRGRVVAAVAGLVLTAGGVILLGYGIVRSTAGPGSSQCSGDGCLDDPWVLAFPIGIIGMVFGLILAGSALSALRDARGSTGPLRAFGFMTGLGAIFALLGGIFLVASSSAQGDDGTFLFLGGLFGIMGLSFLATDLVRFRGELKKDRLRVSGLHGTARVVGVSDTNITVNNSPMVNLDLQVQIAGRQPFRARRRTVISRLSVGALSEGAVIPVLADPARPTDIVLDWDAFRSGDGDPASLGGGSTAEGVAATIRSLAGPGGPLAAGHVLRTGANPETLRSISRALAAAADRAEGGGTEPTLSDGRLVVDGGTTVIVNGRAVDFDTVGRSSCRTAQCDRRGTERHVTRGRNDSPGERRSGGGDGWGAGVVAEQLPARVSLDTIQDTGVEIGGNRVYAFHLTVTVAGRQPYPATHAAVVPAAWAPRLVQGASFPARVDPTATDQITVDWGH